MANTVVLVLLGLFFLFAVAKSIRHFKGEGGCCGGGGASRPSRKRLANAIGRKLVRIEGMHCKNCAAAVTDALNGLDGAAAKVSLRDKSAVLEYDREIPEPEIRRAVEREGFQVVSIEEAR